MGAGVTHAWLQVYLPGAGWVPFDPTNNLVGGPQLIRDGMVLTLIGIAIGLVASLGLGLVLSGALYGISPMDPGSTRQLLKGALTEKYGEPEASKSGPEKVFWTWPGGAPTRTGSTTW